MNGSSSSIETERAGSSPIAHEAAPMGSHLLINGLSIGSGGGYTVARELLLGIARARPDWRVTLALIRGQTLHHEFERETLPSNVTLHWAPPIVRSRLSRIVYETTRLCRWAKQEKVLAIVMLNGQTLSCSGIPVLSHNQDPWPYRPEAWNGRLDRFIAYMKRREHRRGMRHAQVYGWTSHYLRELVCHWQRITPRAQAVFYNGVSEDWLARARTPENSRPIDERALQVVTVSNVSPHKRQDLVVRAIARLRSMPGFESLTYHIIGYGDPASLARVSDVARELEVENAIVIEGRVSPERVRAALAESRVFVLMSVCESFGLPAIEAMTFGTPVVVSDSCAHPEVCADAAALVREDDLDQLVATLRQVLGHRPTAEGLAERGRARAQKFQWATTVEQMLVNLEPMMSIHAVDRSAAGQPCMGSPQVRFERGS